MAGGVRREHYSRVTFLLIKVKICFYLFSIRLRALQILPFLYYCTEVHRIQRHSYLADLVVLREAIEIINGQYQCLRANLGIRYL